MKINFSGFFIIFFMVSKDLFFLYFRVNSILLYISDKFFFRRNVKVLIFKNNYYLFRFFIWYLSCLICKVIFVIYKILSDINRV